MNKPLQDAVKLIDRWLGFQVYLHEVPALSVGVLHDGKIIFAKGYGQANLKTCYRIASISKTFTATALMQLVEQGKIQLDDPVARYLKWFPPNRTIRQLLSHSAGVSRDGHTGHWEDDHFPSLKELKFHAQDGAVVYDPIKRFKYSNWGYAVLGQLIVTVTKMPYEKYMRRNIFEKIKLKATSVDTTETTARLLATGYGRKKPGHKRKPIPYAATKALAPAAGLVSNVSDLCRYMAAQLPGDGRLLTDYSKREMQRIQWVRAEGPPHYGLGYEIWPTGRRQLFGHGAGFNGYRGIMRLDSKHKLGVVLFCNALGVPISQMTEDIYHTLYFFLAGKHQPSKTVKAGKNFSNYQGRFTGRWDEIELINLGSTLWAFSPAQSKPMKFAMRLKQVNSKTFTIMTGDSFDYIGENITFSFDKKGRANTIHFGPNRLTKFT